MSQRIAVLQQFHLLTIDFVPVGDTPTERLISIADYVLSMDPEALREEYPDIDTVQAVAAEQKAVLESGGT
jgi:hypothetical protein